MESSTLRNLAYAYLHFVAGYFDLLGGAGFYQFLVVIFFSVVCAALAMAVYSGKPRRRLVSRVACSAPVYAAALMLAVIWSRLPWFIPTETNVDESMLLAGARKLIFDPVFWRSVDGATSGPLNYYALLLPWAFGLPLDYTTAHLMNALCFGGAIVFLYLTARTILPEWGARLSVLPVLGVVMSFKNTDFTHYSSECVSVLLIMIATWLLATACARPQAGSVRFFAVGLIVASLPFAKLQSIPLGAVLGVAALAAALSRGKKTGWLPTVALAGGALAVAAGLTVFLAVFGQFDTFWQCYIVNNIRYSGASATRWTLHTFAGFFSEAGIGGFLICLLIYLAGAAGYRLYFRRSERRATLSRLSRQSKQNRPEAAVSPSAEPEAAAPGSRYAAWLYSFGFGLAAAAICAVYMPARHFPHYLSLTVMPFGLLSVLAFSWVLSWEARNGAERPWPSAVWHAAAFLGIALVIPCYIISRKPGLDLEQVLGVPAVIDCFPCDLISHYAGPGDLISVWGWAPILFVLTKTVPASHESFTDRQITESSQRDYYRRRFLNDLRQHSPKVFVDTVGPGRFMFKSREEQGHESYPQLAEYVRSNFELADDHKGIRIYVRKDVLAEVSRQRAKVPLRLKCGGAGLTDSGGRQWSSDFYYSRSNIYEFPEAGGIFHTERYCRGACRYTIPIDNGTYRVRLHFMETEYGHPGERVFDIAINGVTVARDFDIVKASGGRFRSLVGEFQATVTGQKLVIEFAPKVHEAKINGIEILPGPAEGRPAAWAN